MYIFDIFNRLSTCV